MTRKHDALFEDVLSGLETKAADPRREKGAARYLKRTTALAEAQERVEKTLLLVDPARCRMWEGHNRRYDLLTPESCADLIEGIRAQGGQEFPAIVRRLPPGGAQDFEVICGARRHFAVTWLRANSYPQMRFLIEPRELTDEEAFRLADIENRDRADISDWERARDYARALAAYYGGRQKAMAERLDVSEAWLSRWLSLAALPEEIVAAYARVTEIREAHARALKPLLANPATRAALLARAAELAGAELRPDGAGVLKSLLATTRPAKPKPAPTRSFRAPGAAGGLTVETTPRAITARFSPGTPRKDLEAAFAALLDALEGGELPIGKKG